MPQITLVPDQHDDDVSIGVVTQLLEPPGHVFVCLVLADVVDEQGTDGASVVSGSDGAVSLLPRGIPDLRLDCLLVDLDRPGGKLDADGRLRVQVELVSRESTEKVGLSDTRVSDKDDCRYGC